VLLLNECLFLLLFISLSTQSGNFWIHPRTYYDKLKRWSYAQKGHNRLVLKYSWWWKSGEWKRDSKWFHSKYKHTSCVCEVAGMILLQACLYTYSLLTGVMFEVPPPPSLNSNELSSTMLPLLETFWELLLWNSFQCNCQNIFYCQSVSWNCRTLRADLIFGDNYKSFGAKLWEQGGCSIPVLDFWDIKRLVSWSTVMLGNPNVGPNFRTFISLHYFHIISLVWIFGLV
jgi:hypothetical protein